VLPRIAVDSALKHLWVTALLSLACVLLPRTVPAREKPAGYNERPVHAEKAVAACQANQARFKGVEHVLVLPGLIADRRRKRIEIFAEATGIRPGVIVEFLLIDAASSKGYEALLWSHARPSDIHRALEFIGIQPGQPFQPGELRFWPKGERVLTGIGAVGDEGRIPLESLIVNKSSGRSLPPAGFVFTGSMMVNKSQQSDAAAYAADVVDPRSVASIYNDSTAVLDVPRRALQHLVYGRQLVSPKYQFQKNELLTVTLEPEYRDGTKRVADVELAIRSAGAKEQRVEFELTASPNKTMVARGKLSEVLAVFGAMKSDGRDPFVAVQFSSELELGVVREMCRVLQAIDTEHGIRIEPPAERQLYYEAFLPDAQLLDLEHRISDPWEVHLQRKGARGTVARVVKRESRFVDGRRKNSITAKDNLSAADLRRHLDAEDMRRKSAGRRPGPRVLLVFCDSDWLYGELVEFLTPATVSHKVVHVFLDAKPDSLQ